MHPVIAEKIEGVRDICQRYDVARLTLFGSAARGVDFNPSTSDVDFLVEFRPDSMMGPFRRRIDLWRALKAHIGCHVDLIRPESVVNPIRKENIYSCTEVVYEDELSCPATDEKDHATSP